MVSLCRAKERGCIDADHPDSYGHYREAAVTAIKHHWWWKVCVCVCVCLLCVCTCVGMSVFMCVQRAPGYVCVLMHARILRVHLCLRVCPLYSVCMHIQVWQWCLLCRAGCRVFHRILPKFSAKMLITLAFMAILQSENSLATNFVMSTLRDIGITLMHGVVVDETIGRYRRAQNNSLLLVISAQKATTTNQILI